jgi:hypothetical protein
MRGLKKPDSGAGCLCMANRWDEILAAAQHRECYCIRQDRAWPDVNFSEAYCNVILQKTARTNEALAT